MVGRLWRAIEGFFTSPKLLLLWFVGVLSGLLAVGLGALVVIEGGLFNATASTPHIPVVALAAHTAFIRSVQVHAEGVSPPGAPFTSAQVVAGFRDYDASCAACHGGPGIPRASWAGGMTPTPPYLSDAGRRWRKAELYWIVSRGVKMTAMPAWGETRSESQLWNLVAFLKALPYLTTADYLRMRAASGNVRAPDALPSSSTASPPPERRPQAQLSPRRGGPAAVPPTPAPAPTARARASQG